MSTTSKNRLKTLWGSLANRAYRDAFVSEHINSGVAVQIYENRRARELTQEQLGALADMGQVRISRLESGDHGTPNLSTLVRLASAFDCGLMVQFVAFSELASWAVDSAEEPLVVPRFTNDSADADSFSGWHSHTADQRYFIHSEETGMAGRHMPTSENKPAEISTGSTMRAQITIDRNDAGEEVTL